MRKYIERLKKFYDKGLYTYDSMIRLLDKGIVDYIYNNLIL